MSEPIKVGDPVMLVWACCAKARTFIGWVGEVEGITHSRTTCGRCGHVSHSTHAWITVSHHGCVPLSWLKKMTPDTDLESEKRDEEITA